MLVFGGSLGARSINLAALEAFGAAPRHSACCTWRAAATIPELAGRELPADMTCASTSMRRSSPTRSPPPTWWSRARAGRCSRSPRTACRRSSCPTRTPPPTIRARTRAGWPQAGAAIVIPDGELTAARLAAEVARAARRRRRLAAMARASRGLARPQAARRSPVSCWRRPRERRPSGPWSGRRLHFVGVGGAGMSGYARAAHALGAEVSGSDAAAGPTWSGLRADGVLEASIGHDAENVPAGEGVEVDLLERRARRRTPSARPRASGGLPSARARSCWRSSPR